MAYKREESVGQSQSNSSSNAPSNNSSSGSTRLSANVSPSRAGTASSNSNAGKSSKVSQAASNARAAIQAGRADALANKQKQTGQTQAARYQARTSGSSSFGSSLTPRPLTGTFSQQGKPAKAGIYAGGGLNPSAWGSSMASPSVQRDDSELQKAINDLTVPTDYADRNLHAIDPDKNADESYLQEAQKWNMGRQVWAYNDTQGVFSREYASDEEKLSDILDLMSHAQVYYNDAKKNDYKFTIGGEEVSAADQWKDLYDKLDRYSGWLTDTGQVRDLFTRYQNGEDITMENVEAMTARAQARRDNPYDDEDAAMWQEILDDLGFVWNRANRTDARKLQEQIDAYKEQLAATQDEASSLETSQGWMDSADVFVSDADRERINSRAAELKAERAGILADQQALQEQLDQLNSNYRERNMTPEIERALAEQSMDDFHRELYYSNKAREELTRLDEEGRVTNAAVSIRAREMQEQNQKLLDDWNRGLGFTPQFYNNWDIARAGISAAAQQSLAGAVGAASWIAKAGEAMGAGNTEYGSGRPAGTAAPERTVIANVEEGRALAASLSTQIADLEAQRQALLNQNRAAGVDGDGKMFHSRTLTQSTARLRDINNLNKALADLHEQLGDIEFQMKQMNGEPTSVVDKLRYMSAEEIAARADSVVDQMDKNSAELIEQAKASTGDFGKFLIDVEVNGLQMMGDQLFGPASLAALGVRVFGNETAERRREGYDIWEQGEAGAISAGIEVLSESMFRVLNLYGGHSITGEATERLVKEWADTPFGRSVMRTILATAGEQAEEVFAWGLEPIADIALGEKDWAALNPFNREDESYEELVSAILTAGALAGLGSLNVRAQRDANNQLLFEDVTEFGERSDQYERDIESATSEMTPFTDEQQSNYDRAQVLQSRIENTLAGTRTVDEQGQTINPEEVKRQETARINGQQGYIARFEQSPLMQKIRQNTQNIISRGQKPSTEAQPIDNGGTIDQEQANAMAQSQNETIEGQNQNPAPAPEKKQPIDQAKANAMAASQTAAIEGQNNNPAPAPNESTDEETARKMAGSQSPAIESQDKNPAPAPKKERAPEAPEMPSGEEAGSPPAGTPESPASSVKPKGNAPRSDLGTAAARKEKSEQNKAAHRQLQEDNANRQTADNEAIDTAIANAEAGQGSKVSFEGKLDGKPVTITYDPEARTIVYTYEDGTTSDPVEDVGPREAKKLVNEARSTLKTGEAQPSSAVVINDEAEEADTPESAPAGPDERIVSAIRNAQDFGELQRLFMSDPDAFADAYEVVAGKPLGHGNQTIDDIETLYATLHPDEGLSGVTDEEVAAAEANATTDAEDEAEVPTAEDAVSQITPAEETAPASPEVKGAVKVSPEAPAATVVTESTAEPSDAALVTDEGKVTTKANAGPKTAADGTTLDTVVQKITDKEITSDQQLTQYFGRKGEIGSWATLANALGVEVKPGGDAHRAVKNWLNAQNAPQAETKGRSKAKAPSVLTPVAVRTRMEAEARENIERLFENYGPTAAGLVLPSSKISQQLANNILQAAVNSKVYLPGVKFTRQDIARIAQTVLEEKGIEIKYDEDNIPTNLQDIQKALVSDAYKAATDRALADRERAKRQAEAIAKADARENAKELKNKDAILSAEDVRALVLGEEEITQTTEGGTQSVYTGLPGEYSGRILGGDEEGVRRILENAQARGDKGVRAEDAFNVWKNDIRDVQAAGARCVKWEEFTPETREGVKALLDNDIPYVTVLDLTNCDELPSYLGFVDGKHPELGIFLVQNHPNAYKVNAGIVLLHEPVHYFAGEYERKNGVRPDFFDLIERVANTFIDSEAVYEDILRAEERFSGRSMLRGLFGREFTDEEWNDYRLKTMEERHQDLTSWIKTNRPELADNAGWLSFQYFEKISEEAVANLAAHNPALKFDHDELSDFPMTPGDMARELIYHDGLAPNGFFEQLDNTAESYTSAIKAKGPKTNQKASIPLARNQYGFSPEMQELQDLSTESTPQEKADARIQGYLEEFPELQQKYGNQAVSEPGQNLANSLKDTPGNRIESMYVMPDGEEDGARINTPVSEKILPEERAKAGEVKYKRTSLRSVGEAAHETIQNVLSDETLGFDELVKHLRGKNPGALSTLEQQMVNELYRRVQTQRHNLLHRKGTVHDSLIPTDAKELWKIEKQLREISSESAGEGARKVTQQRFSMTPEQEVWNNLSHTFLGDKDPTTEDSESIEAKMYNAGATMLDGIADIDARREAGEIDEKQAVSEMVEFVREINKIRDVSRTFGPAGQLMAKWEQACLNRIASKGGEDAYDTLRMIALGSVNRINSDFDAVGVTNTIKQIRYLNLLSNPATKISNLINNFESSLSGAIGQNIAVKTQGKRVQKIMGVDVPLTMNENWHRGFIGKKNKALNEYMLTKGAESVLSLYYGLDVDEGVVDIDLGAKHNQNGNAASRLLATFQFMSGLGMTTTDAMAIARAYRGMEMNIDAMNISEARKAQMKADAMLEARRQMYHADSKAAKTMENLRDVLNGVTILGNKETGAIGLGDITMPFVQVPTNVALRAMRATPLGVTYGIAKYWQGMNRLQAKRETYDRVQALKKKKEAGAALNAEEMKFLRENQNVSEPTDAEVRKLMRGLGESATNASATVLAMVATMMGALRDFDDEDDEAMKRLAQERGFTGIQLNLSNLMRLGKGGWKKDDVVIGGSWMEVLAIPMVTGQHLVKNWLEEDPTAGGLASAILESPLTTFQTFVDAAQEIPGIAQIADIWDAYENLQNYSLDKQKSRFVAGLSQYASNAASTFVIPNAVAQFAAGMDNKHRDVYRADTNMEIAANIWKNKLPGRFFGIGRETLPEAKSSLGASRPYGSNRAMGVANRVLFPGTGVQRWIPSKLEEKYQQFADAGKKVESVAPAKSAPSKITSLDGKEYTPNAGEARYFDETNTENAVRLQYGLMNNPEFEKLSLDQQWEAMNKVRQFEYHVAETEFLLSKGDDSGVQMDNWEKLYCNIDGDNVTISDYEKATQYALAYAAARDVYSSKTRTFTGAESTEWFLKNVYSKLDDAQRVAFDGSFPSMDKLYDGYTKAGITPEEYNKIRELNKEYTDRAKDKDNEVSYSEAQRDLAVRYDEEFGGEKAKWATENNKIWYTLPASTTTPDKLVGAGLTIKEADEWLDRKSGILPAEGYKEPSLNQIIQNIAGDTSLNTEKQWRVLLTDGDVSESARNRLAEYKLAHPNATLLDAVNNVTYWYKNPYNKNSKGELRSYAEVYGKEENEKSYPYAEELASKYGLSA